VSGNKQLGTRLAKKKESGTMKRSCEVKNNGFLVSNGKIIYAQCWPLKRRKAMADYVRSGKVTKELWGENTLANAPLGGLHRKQRAQRAFAKGGG